jgi:transposase
MICGVDVSQQSLEVRIEQGGPGASFANTKAGIFQLAEFCRVHQVHLVAMEASGGYERLALLLLSAEQIPVAILNPRAVRKFAEAMGYLEKTDALDAGVIALFARTRKSEPSSPGSAQLQHLRALVTRLRQLTDLQTAQRNQQLLVTDPTVQQLGRQLLQVVKTQIRSLEKAIAQLIDADPLWQQLNQSFRSIKGVASRTVSRLMAEMPEIGTLSNKKIAKLAGLAPLACDSGKMRGKRVIAGGRRPIRDTLFMVAGVVARFHPDFIAFRQRLTAAGKAKKVVRVALAHKLLTRLNAKAREVRLQFTQITPPAKPAENSLPSRRTRGKAENARRFPRQLAAGFSMS